MTKIIEWCGEHIVGVILSACFIAIVISAILLVNIIEHLTTPPDQPKMSIAETNIAEPIVLYGLVDYSKAPPFNPATDEITRVDTVGRQRKLTKNNPLFPYWWANNHIPVNLKDCIYTWTSDTCIDNKPFWFNGWEAVTESTIVPKTSPLLTREENKILEEIIEEWRKK